MVRVWVYNNQWLRKNMVHVTTEKLRLYYIIIKINCVYYYVINCVESLNPNRYVLRVVCYDPNVFWIFIECFIASYISYIKTRTAQTVF